MISTIIQHIASTWPWYVTRASGIVALLVLMLLLVSGVGAVTGKSYRWFEPLHAWLDHRILGYILSMSIVVHIVTLFLDKYIGFSLADITVPFWSTYKPVTMFGWNISLGMAFGILSMYILTAIVITSLIWIQRKPKSWKLIHYLSYGVVGFVLLHAWLNGTDMANPVWLVTLVVFGLITLWMIIVRLRRA